MYLHFFLIKKSFLSLSLNVILNILSNINVDNTGKILEGKSITEEKATENLCLFVLILLIWFMKGNRVS